MSKEMKVIMEGWRDFFKKKPKEKLEPKDSALFKLGANVGQKPNPPAFFVKKQGKYHKIILWRPSSHDFKGRIMDGEILAMIWVSKTKGPCIPETYEVNFSAVSKQLQGKGIGSLIYGLTFYYVNNELNAGLTSDHSASSNKKSQVMWDKYADTKNMVKKQTGAGNDEFDYENKTPDDDDDCGVGEFSDITLKSMFFGKKYRDGVATHSSWIMEPNQFTKDYDILTRQQEKYAKEARNIRNLENNLVSRSSDFFVNNY